MNNAHSHMARLSQFIFPTKCMINDLGSMRHGIVALPPVVICHPAGPIIRALVIQNVRPFQTERRLSYDEISLASPQCIQGSHKETENILSEDLMNKNLRTVEIRRNTHAD